MDQAGAALQRVHRPLLDLGVADEFGAIRAARDAGWLGKHLVGADVAVAHIELPRAGRLGGWVARQQQRQGLTSQRYRGLRRAGLHS
jgi:hypothetical protein